MALNFSPTKFQEYLKSRRARKKPISKSQVRIPRLIPPIALERRYYKDLLTIVNEMNRLIEKTLIPKLTSIVKQADKLKPTGDSSVAKLDSYDDQVRRLLDLIRSGFFSKYSDKYFLDMAAKIASAISSQNEKAINSIFRSVLGVDVFITEPWLKTELAAFANANVALIKSMSERHFSRIEYLVFDGVRKGLRHEEIAAMLRSEPFNATKNQAALIARDQVSKLNGQLTELRQKKAGISRYIWRTAGDERVRDSHKALDGQTIFWDSPPEVGHPGYDFQCRCYAEPVIEDLLEE
jgi:SPP1 gp7 family putative phage head morphogenesis protein